VDSKAVSGGADLVVFSRRGGLGWVEMAAQYFGTKVHLGFEAGLVGRLDCSRGWFGLCLAG